MTNLQDLLGEWAGIHVETCTNRANDFLAHPSAWLMILNKRKFHRYHSVACSLANIALSTRAVFDECLKIANGGDKPEALLRISELLNPRKRGGLVRNIHNYCKNEISLFHAGLPLEYQIYCPIESIESVLNVLERFHHGEAVWESRTAFYDLASPMHWMSMELYGGFGRFWHYFRIRRYLAVFEKKMEKLSREIYLMSKQPHPSVTMKDVNRFSPSTPGTRLDNHRRLVAAIEDSLEEFRVERKTLLLKRNEQPCHPKLKWIADWINETRSMNFPKKVTRKMVETAMENALGRTIDEVKAILHNRDVKRTQTYRSKKEKLNGNPEYFSPTICVYWVGLLNEKFVLSDKPTNWKKAFQNLNTIEAVLDAVNTTPSLD